VKILIIDDHPLFREGLQFVLSDLEDGLSFKEAPGLSDISDENLHNADLILLDLGISGSTGIESLDKLRALNPPGSIVIISSDDDPYLIRDCIDGGAAGFIPKTSQPAVLIAALSLVLAGGIYLPAHSIADPIEIKTQRAENEAVNKLTDRQCTALLLAGRGFPNKTIASKMAIAEGTVKLHLHAAFKTLGVKNRTEAVFLISRTGLTNKGKAFRR
jgi:DNA-binding NarL/FixJ family response regulator